MGTRSKAVKSERKQANRQFKKAKAKGKAAARKRRTFGAAITEREEKVLRSAIKFKSKSRKRKSGGSSHK